MKAVLGRALAFSAVAFAVLLAADLLVWVGYQGAHPRDQLSSSLAVRGVLHVSVLLLSLAGAAAAFSLLRTRLPPIKVASLSGALFALVSFIALVAALGAAGVLGGVIWLLLGSAAVAYASALLAGARHG